MTLHEETARAEIIRVQIALLNDTLGLGISPNDMHDCVVEILRLSRLIK